MSEHNQEAVDKKLDRLKPDDRTNIWGGLEQGIDVLYEGFLKN